MSLMLEVCSCFGMKLSPNPRSWAAATGRFSIGQIVKSLVSQRIEVAFRGHATKHILCIKVIREGEVWQKAIGSEHFPLEFPHYLRVLRCELRPFPLDFLFDWLLFLFLEFAAAAVVDPT